jgi:hypothetical protein
MGCVPGITKDILSTCQTQPIGGVEVKGWIGNRLEMTPTYDVTNESKITSLAVASTKQLYTITGVKKLLNAGFDRVVGEDRADSFTHYFNFQGFEFDAESVEGMDNLDDIVVIVEMKEKPTDADGTFRVFGMKNGLYPSTDTMRANDIDGARNIEMTSLDGQGEPWSNYTLLATDYATTLALLVSLESAQL